MSAAAVAVEPTTNARVVALVGGTLAVVLAATLVITLTPQQTATTTAISATTVPATPSLSDTASIAVAAAESIRTSTLSSATAIPNAIADVPAAAFRPASISADAPVRVVLPDLDGRVTVLTEQFTYAVAWRDVSRLDLDDAIVVDHEGTVVARFTNGQFIVSHDLLLGASITVD